MSDSWGQRPPPNNQQPWGQPPQSPTQQPWGQPLQPPPQQPWGQPPPPPQQPWGQQATNYGWQQPLPGQFQQAPQPPKKKNRLWLVLGIVVGVLVLSTVLCGVINSLPKTSNTASTTGDQTATPGDTSTSVAQVVQPTTVPTATPTPAPTKTSAQIEASYKTSTISTTVTNLDKDGAVDKGKDVHFISKISMFVKDSAGNTVGANVEEQDSYSSSYVQVQFTSGTDITKLNEGDILEVWGSDDGVFSGTNAYGGTVQAVGITAQYMLDQTTNYQVDN